MMLITTIITVKYGLGPISLRVAHWPFSGNCDWSFQSGFRSREGLTCPVRTTSDRNRARWSLGWKVLCPRLHVALSLKDHHHHHLRRVQLVRRAWLRSARKPPLKAHKAAIMTTLIRINKWKPIKYDGNNRLLTQAGCRWANVLQLKVGRRNEDMRKSTEWGGWEVVGSYLKGKGEWRCRYEEQISRVNLNSSHLLHISWEANNGTAETM